MAMWGTNSWEELATGNPTKLCGSAVPSYSALFVQITSALSMASPSAPESLSLGPSPPELGAARMRVSSDNQTATSTCNLVQILDQLDHTCTDQ